MKRLLNHLLSDKNIMKMNITLLSIAIVLFCGSISLANETAAGLGASGIYFKEEKNISIEQEDLYISQEKVKVTYLFKNHSDKDIVTEVAFPIPEYDYNLTLMGSGVHGDDFSDFSVNVDGENISYLKEVRALLNGKDVTQLLTDLHIAIESHGEQKRGRRHLHLGNLNNENSFYTIFNKMTEKDKQLLISSGLVSTDPALRVPLWSVAIKYHWKQRFPANSTVKVEHTYTPRIGLDYFQNNYFTDACISQETKKWLDKAKRSVHIRYVKYILLTANNWKQPIKKFHITVDQPQDEVNSDNTAWHDSWNMSICFDTILTRVSTTRFEKVIPNYIPTKDITVYYFMR